MAYPYMFGKANWGVYKKAYYQHTEDVAVMGELAARLLVRHYEHLCAGQKELT